MSKRCTAGTRSTLSMKQLTGKKMTNLEESRMLRKKYYLYLDNQEYSILLKSLVALKNKLIQQERFADCVDELIMKVIAAPVNYI